MKKETIEFIKVLFEGYRDSSSGKEPENAEELKKAWYDFDNWVNNDAKEKRIVEPLRPRSASVRNFSRE